MDKELRLLVAGRWRTSAIQKTIQAPYSGEAWAEVPLADKNVADEAIRGAFMAFDMTKGLSSFQKKKILLGIGNEIIRRKQELLEALVHEAGKTINEAREELARAVFTFRAASDAVQSLATASYPADIMREGLGVMAFSRRFPIGPILCVSSFSYPLDSIALKVAPAIAAGNPVVLCPAPETPVAALLLGEILLESGYPQGAVSVLPCDREVRRFMVDHDGIRMVAYSGNSETGWDVKAHSGRKKTLLQMSGLGISIVHKDAELEYAARLCVQGAYKNAGQIDSSLQRIMVHEDVFFQFLGKFIKKTNQLEVGDPALEATEVGPVINEEAAIRLESWIRDAVDQGAEVVSGGKREGALVQPTVFLEVREDMLICREEAFGPLVAITPFTDVEQAVWTVHDMDYGLQTSLFTNDLGLVMRAYRFLDVGAVLVNELPTFRVATLPHGGMKNSSFGRESVAESIKQMSEEKLLVVNTRGRET